MQTTLQEPWRRHGVTVKCLHETGKYYINAQYRPMPDGRLMSVKIFHKYQEDIKLIKDLSKEIYLDTDFKELVINYMNATAKVLKYFRILSGYSAGVMGGKPTNLSHGLGLSMSDSELRFKVSEKLSSLGEYIEHLGDMFQTVLRRYESRLQN